MAESAPDSETRGSGAKVSQYAEFPWQATPESLGWNLTPGGLSGPHRRTRPTFGPETAWRGTPLEAGGCEPRRSWTRHGGPQWINSTNEPGMSMKTKDRDGVTCRGRFANRP